MLIERSDYAGDDFMQEIIDMITSLVKTYEKVKGADVLMPKESISLGKCPVCGKSVIERPKSFSCSDRKCKFALWKNDRFFAAIGKSMNSTVAKQLLASGKVKLKGCVSAKTGRKYNATVWMNLDENGKYQFSMDFEKGGKK